MDAKGEPVNPKVKSADAKVQFAPSAPEISPLQFLQTAGNFPGVGAAVESADPEITLAL